MNGVSKSSQRDQFRIVENAINAFCEKCVNEGHSPSKTILKNDLNIGQNSQYRKLITALQKQDNDKIKALLHATLRNSFIGNIAKCPETLRKIVRVEHFAMKNIQEKFIEFGAAYDVVINPSAWWKPSPTGHLSSNLPENSNAKQSVGVWELAETYLQRGVPSVSKVPVSENAKEKLYGGDPQLSLSPIELVALGHNFTRKDVVSLSQEIFASEATCRTITFTAAHGTGLSLALAQLVKELSQAENSEVLSITGDPNQTTVFLESLDRSEAGGLASWAANLPCDTANLTLVIDDVSETSQSGWQGLYKFISECEKLFVADNLPKLTFALGWFGTAPKFSNVAFPLRLTNDDILSCYQKMTTGDPPIIAQAENGHSEILRKPESVRALGNDAQALIDFFIEHGHATRRLKKHWLAGIDHSRSHWNDPLTLTAAAQTLDLSIPEQIAVRRFAKRSEYPKITAAKIADNNKRLIVTQSHDAGEGIGLSCPRRANSILARVKRGQSNHALDWLDTDCIDRDFCVLISTALASYEAHEPNADISLNFARHIFQRLGKKEFLPLVGEVRKGVIGNRLAITFQTWIIRLSNRWAFPTKMKWAATMSAYLTNSRTVSDVDRSWQQAWADFATQICQDVIEGLSEGSCEKTPSLMLGLMRSVRRLHITKYFEGSAITLMRQARAIVAPDALCGLIAAQLECRSEDSIYRANELLHQWCRFEESYASPSQSEAGCKEIYATLDRVKGIFDVRQVLFDPASLIEFSRYIWDRDPDRDLRQKAILQKLHYLHIAEAAVIENPRIFASWDAKLQAEMARVKALQIESREMDEYE